MKPMKVLPPLSGALIAAALLLVGCAPKKSFVGTWKGTLSVSIPGSPNPILVPLTFHVTSKDDKVYSATVDSPAQRATGFPVDSFAVDGEKVTITIKPKTGAATFTGTANSDASQISGNLDQSGKTLPLTLKKEPDAK